MAYDISSEFFPPNGLSVNDGLDQEEKTVSYATFDEVVKMIAKCGRGALLAKVDLLACFMRFPILPGDFYLLGVKFEGQVFVDKVLSMGLAKAPKIAEELSTFLEWKVRQLICPADPDSVAMTHYLDDFLFGSQWGTVICHNILGTFEDTCQEAGVPLAGEKRVTPTTELVFRGLTLTTFPELQTKVPQDKRDAAASLIKTFLVRSKVRVREIESLVGKLNFLCQAVCVGRPFLRRLYDLVSQHKIKTHRLSLKISVKKTCNFGSLS